MATDWSKAPKDPEDVTDFTVDWSAQLKAGATISGATFAVASGDVVIEEEDNDNTTATVRLSAGTVALSPSIVNCHVVMSDGQERDLDGAVHIKERVTK